MSIQSYEQTIKDHALFMEERKILIDAARESARTFDQAVLAFGSALFGASIVFLKDVAPKPQLYTLKWLGISWGFFSVGLLGVMLSFLFSHRACMFEIKVGSDALGNPQFKRPKNHLSSATDWCNYLCVSFLFCGLLSWSMFAFENLAQTGYTMTNPKPPSQSDMEKRGYVPPPAPPRNPSPSPASPAPQPPKEK